MQLVDRFYRFLTIFWSPVAKTGPRGHKFVFLVLNITFSAFFHHPLIEMQLVDFPRFDHFFVPDHGRFGDPIARKSRPQA